MLFADTTVFFAVLLYCIAAVCYYSVFCVAAMYFVLNRVVLFAVLLCRLLCVATIFVANVCCCAMQLIGTVLLCCAVALLLC